MIIPKILNLVDIYISYGIIYTVHHRRRIKTAEKANVLAVVWGDILECCTNHYSSKDDLNKIFWRTSTLVGWW